VSHKRTLILSAVETMLLNNTVADDRIYKNRAFNIQVDKLPAISLDVQSENAQPRDIRTSIYIRKLLIKIIATISSSDDYNTELDDFCLQIETLFNSNRNISGTATGCVYQGTELSFEPGTKTLAEATLTYEITYLT
jgi:hypothetical protein